MVRAFFYALGFDGNTSSGRITGVPAECGGTVFMGFCMPKIRSAARRADWIIAVSNAKIKPRWILSIIQVGSRPKLWKARKLYPEAIWSPTNPRGHIWVEPIEEGDEIEYRYIPGAPHDEPSRKNDLETYPGTDRLIVGTSNSVILGEHGIPVDSRTLAMMKRDPRLKSADIDPSCPFGKVLRKKQGEQNKQWASTGRPEPAIIDLNVRDIKYLKGMAKTAKKRTPKTTQTSPRGKRGCRTPRRRMPTYKSKRKTC